MAKQNSKSEYPADLYPYIYMQQKARSLIIKGPSRYIRDEHIPKTKKDFETCLENNLWSVINSCCQQLMAGYGMVKEKPVIAGQTAFDILAELLHFRKEKRPLTYYSSVAHLRKIEFQHETSDMKIVLFLGEKIEVPIQWENIKWSKGSYENDSDDFEIIKGKFQKKEGIIIIPPSGPVKIKKLSVKEMHSYIREKAKNYLEKGPALYRKEDAFGMPPRSWEKGKVKKAIKILDEGCRQILALKGLSINNPITGIGMRGFYCLMQLFHFNVIDHYSGFNKDIGFNDAMIMEHIVYKTQIKLYNFVGQNEGKLIVEASRK